MGVSDAPDLKVVSLFEANANDIPAMAREMATDIEAGDYGDVTRAAVVLLTSDGAVEVFGWGKETQRLEVLGMFQLGTAALTKGAV